jgi:glycosyltransferase involved in cell wall biosynthesis
MGHQDRVDLTLRSLEMLVHEFGRTDCSLVLMGFGDTFESLKDLAVELKVDEYVTFTGRVGPTEMADYLSTADLGLCPDPKSPLNDVSTMNKTMEYMAYALPVLTFDLVETRVSAGEAARYIEDGDLYGFTKAWDELLSDAQERVRLGTLGRARVAEELDWAPQSRKYVQAWRELLGTPMRAAHVQLSESKAPARPYIDLGDAEGFATFVRDRGRD